MSESNVGARGGNTGRGLKAPRKLPPIRERVYALRPYTVKTEDGKYYIAQTAAFQKKLDWKGPYSSLQHATSAIARMIQAEFSRRDKAAVS
jgi:hypothetical protein